MNKIIISVLIMSSLLFSYEMNYDKNTTGLIRQLKIYKNPKWIAKVELKNGKNVFFSSPKSMFEFYFKPRNWYELGVRHEGDFENLIVTDYATMKLVNAKGAFFVYGTNAVSPAGDDLVAFDSYKSATEFSAKHRGQRIFGFRDVSLALINLLNGKL